MDIEIYETISLRPGSIVSGNQIRYLVQSHLPLTLQAVMVHLFNKTNWSLASTGRLQTLPVRYKSISEKLNVSVRSVQRYICSLIDEGEIVVHERYGEFGEQLPNIFTMPRLVQFLKGFKIKDIEKEIGEDPATFADREVGGDNDDTPLKQNSSTKRNTYIHFTEIRKKDEFLSVDGSIRNIPQLCKIIRKAQPGIDPDLIYLWFKEFISPKDFKLRDHIPSYFTLLRIFAHKFRLPGDNSKSSKPPKAVTNPTPSPEIRGELSELRQQLCQAIGASKYVVWFSDVEFSSKEEPQTLVVKASTNFARNYLSTTFSDVIEYFALRHTLRRVEFTSNCDV